ncbi:MAG: bifunctional diaminohydroxyphosphoribosylaminopyrimidine deaminase/5-amino-6-(5-phosphoribosylamino)uracil reductase RibD [Alphaproteobacteria bacterium]
MKQNYDEKFMNLALNLSLKNIGATAENPAVGCVIVKNFEILATAITSKSGRPHAEINAINKISDKNILKDCTLYVTLEPCSHIGKTGPCVDEIIKYKFKKVVIASIDPDPRVNGNGIKKLQQAGIEVVLGTCNERMQEINRGFFLAKKLGLPFTTMKIASSFDGKIATKNQHSKWITCQKSREFSHNLRSKNQAIIIGGRSIKADDPILNTRLEGLMDLSPIPIIISKNLDFSFQEKIFTENKSTQKIIITTENNFNKNSNLQNWLKLNDGHQALYIKDLEGRNHNFINLKLALQELIKFNINSVLIEGGGQIFSEFLRQNLVDELVWIKSPIIIGNDGIPAINAFGAENLSDALQNLQPFQNFNIDQDHITIFKKTNY